MKTKRVPLNEIRFDGETQMRECLNGDAVADYRDAMKDGQEFPPIVVFFDGSDNWIGDGYHRWHAAGEAGLDDIACDVRQGSRRDAILFACSANKANGLRRTNADKRRAVTTILSDAEWVKWSDVVISELCGVGRSLVCDVRSQLAESASSSNVRIGKDGKKRDESKRKEKAKEAAAAQGRAKPTAKDIREAVEQGSGSKPPHEATQQEADGPRKAATDGECPRGGKHLWTGSRGDMWCDKCLEPKAGSLSESIDEETDVFIVTVRDTLDYWIGECMNEHLDAYIRALEYALCKAKEVKANA